MASRSKQGGRGHHICASPIQNHAAQPLHLIIGMLSGVVDDQQAEKGQCKRCTGKASPQRTGGRQAQPTRRGQCRRSGSRPRQVQSALNGRRCRPPGPVTVFKGLIILANSKDRQDTASMEGDAGFQDPQQASWPTQHDQPRCQTRFLHIIEWTVLACSNLQGGAEIVQCGPPAMHFTR